MPKYRVPLERGAHAHVRIHLIQHSVKTGRAASCIAGFPLCAAEYLGRKEGEKS
jgi:hypothetical protein